MPLKSTQQPWESLNVEGVCTFNVSVGKTDVGSLSFDTVSTCPGRNICVLSPVHPESLSLISRGLRKHRHRDHRTQFLRGVLWCEQAESKISLATTNLVANTFRTSSGFKYIGKLPRPFCFLPGDSVICFISLF